MFGRDSRSITATTGAILVTISNHRTHLKRVVRFAAGITAAGAVLGATLAPTIMAQTLPVQTGQIQSTNALALTVAETEGPFYKAGSPEATNLVPEAVQGQVITVTGQVLDQTGQPVANALLDFWQANASGAYDNAGYTLRGHQYTDANGNFTLTTVVPGLYPGRTEHIHVKVQAPNAPVLTTQLFFPGVSQNNRDSIYDPSLLMNVSDNGDGTLSATYTFVVATA
jgi:protocatechuate 3,4-dioxygenase beta subunit